MTRLQAPEGLSSPIIVRGGKEYEPDDDGVIICDNPDHEKVLRRHGCTVLSRHAAPAPSRRSEPAPKASEEDEEDEFDGMTKAELIDWLEERDIEVPNKPKLAQLQALCREHKSGNS